MEWLSSIRRAIDYMEAHLEENISAVDVASEVNMSSFFFQRGFSIMTGYTVAEYLRNRRLYKAAVDLANGDDKIIDIAFRYCYETPESFAKAFSRFHGAAPSEVRKGGRIKTFLPLVIEISIHGGNLMDYKIQTRSAFKVIGFERIFESDTSYQEIPKFWREYAEKYLSNILHGKEPTTAQEKAIAANCVGEYGICIDDLAGGAFRYLIAGMYTGGDVPAGMTVYEIPAGDWAIFDCYGANPKTLQETNTKIYKEWLPANPDYEFSGKASVEWYSKGDMTDANYHSAIWIPIKKRV